jgi:hypothetical protein
MTAFTMKTFIVTSEQRVTHGQGDRNVHDAVQYFCSVYYCLVYTFYISSDCFVGISLIIYPALTSMKNRRIFIIRV